MAKRTPEQRERMRQAQLAYHARKRANGNGRVPSFGDVLAQLDKLETDVRALRDSLAQQLRP